MPRSPNEIRDSMGVAQAGRIDPDPMIQPERKLKTT